jgi:hypothetical protein
MRDTLQNEFIGSSSVENVGLGDEMSKSRLLPLSLNNNTLQTHLNLITSPSPSAESLTETTNSSFAMRPVGESQDQYRWNRVQQFDDISLPLHPIHLVGLPAPRELIIIRRKTQWF